MTIIFFDPKEESRGCQFKSYFVGCLRKNLWHYMLDEFCVRISRKLLMFSFFYITFASKRCFILIFSKNPLW